MYKRPRKVDLALVLLAAGLLPAAGAPAEKASSIPQFGFADYAWSKVSDDFATVEGAGPGPVTYDKSSPYTNNQRAGAGRPITLRIADLSNPILKPWAIESMRKANDLAAAGKSAGLSHRNVVLVNASLPTPAREWKKRVPWWMNW